MPWNSIPANCLSVFVAADVGIGFISRSNIQEDVKATLWQLSHRRRAIAETWLWFSVKTKPKRAALAFYRDCGEDQDGGYGSER